MLATLKLLFSLQKKNILNYAWNSLWGHKVIKLQIGKRISNKKSKPFSRNRWDQGPVKTVYCKKISESLSLE